MIVANSVYLIFFSKASRDLFTESTSQRVSIAILIIFVFCIVAAGFVAVRAKSASRLTIDTLVQRGYDESKIIPLLGAVSPHGKRFFPSHQGARFLAWTEDTFELFDRAQEEAKPTLLMSGRRLGTEIEFRRVDDLYNVYFGTFWGFQITFRDEQQKPQTWQFVPVTAKYRRMRKREATALAESLQPAQDQPTV